MIAITIDGQALEIEPDATVLDAMTRLGIAVPALCHDDRLRPAGDCRLCMVEIDGAPHPMTACTTTVADGMRVTTRSAELLHFRETLLGWMAGKASPGDVERFPEKPLHRAMTEAGIAPAAAETPDAACDLSHPYIRVDMSRCVTCLRCVRICDEVQGQSVWHAVNRGADTHIVPDSGTTLGASTCVGCGACVDTCPTAALTDRRARPASARPTRTVCVYCGVGCEIEVATAGGRIVGARPAADAPVNKGHLCVKGRYAFGFEGADDRQLHPMLRNAAGGWRRASWDDALDRVAAELRRITDAHGPHAVGILGSARATNEDNYVAQKFARVAIGTHNVDSCARVCHTPTAAAMKAMLGTGAATNSFDDIERAATILVVGANPTDNHPVVGARIRQRAGRGGANLIVVDPRRTELAAVATIHLAPRPGTNIPLFNALAHVVVAEDLADGDFVHERVTEWDEFQAHVSGWTPERAAAICGVPADAIRAAARLYATATPSMCLHGLGVTEHVQGTEGVMTLVNLALITGNIGRPGTGINPLRGQNNVQGAAHMGCDPSILTGSVAIPERRGLFERVWGTTLSDVHGLNLLAMVDAAAAGDLKALWVVGYDIYLTLANEPATRRALERLELVVVQDLFLTETADAFGHVFLPATSVFEKDGTFMNAERRVQRVRAALPPAGEARHDWRILADVAARLGRGDAFAFTSAEDIWNEIRQVWPEGAGIDYRRLDERGLQWPCRDAADPGTTILHAASFARGRTAALRRIDYAPTTETTDAAFPFMLTTGRDLYQFNAGTMTMRTRNVELRPSDTIDVAPVDAERLGIGTGDRVRVRSRHGVAILPARVTDAVKPGEAFATFHVAATFLNRITGPRRDRITLAPEYKVTAVALEPA
ncbi:MAG: formate dehydrogenase subunit alpha [Rhodospirillales bacterium]|nr:MAG: formate dehydrogenase subunit alpha [Rhodospirillales bacterium]